MEPTNDKVYTDEDGGLVVPASEIHRVVPNPTVTLADGTKLKGSAALNITTPDLWIWIEKESGSMAELFPLFNDPNKTQRIETTYLDTDTPTVYEGYTFMTVIKTYYDGRVSIRLNQP